LSTLAASDARHRVKALSHPPERLRRFELRKRRFSTQLA
jgi:hypothetical protein